MARWKARVRHPIRHNWTFFASFYTVDTLQGKTCQTSLLSGHGGSVWAKISGGRGRPSGIFFGFYKTRHILLYDSANRTVLRAVVLTQYRRVTDRQTDRRTDGIAVASTALAMRALRRAVKSVRRFDWYICLLSLWVTIWLHYSARKCSHCKRCISYSNSVCPSHAGIVSTRRHVARCSLHHSCEVRRN